MRIVHHKHAHHFLHFAQAFLETREAENNLILGLARRYDKEEALQSLQPQMYTFDVEEKVEVAFFRTPPRNGILFAEAEDWPKWGLPVAHCLFDALPDMPGIVLPAGLMDGFVPHWERLAGKTAELRFADRVYRLDEVTAPRPSGGHMRLVRADELPLAEQYFVEFHQEAMNEVHTQAAFREDLMRRQAADYLYWWEDGTQVCLASFGRPTRHGITIGYVYTPPAHRGKGYASNLVAGMSQLALDQGYGFISLWADLANSTSNKIYEAIGYEQVMDWNIVEWK